MRVRHEEVIDVQRNDEYGTSELAGDVDVTDENKDLDVGVARRSAVTGQPVVKLLAPNPLSKLFRTW